MKRMLKLAALIVLLISCVVNPVTGKKELSFLSPEQEFQMGRSTYPSALWGDVGGGGPYSDQALTSYLNGIVQNLRSVSHRPEVPTDFVIQNSSVPNAWALPGHVAITRGLLTSLENEAQFAFVMGHEIGHVAARHQARQYTRSVLTGAVLGGGALVLGEERGWLLSAASIGGTLFLLKYSRDQELEADRLGVAYMSKAGYRPLEAVNAHERLIAAVNEYSARMGKGTPEDNFLSELLSTHPRTEVRLEEVRQMAAQEPPQKLKGDGVQAAPFNSHLASIRRIQQGYVHYDKALAAYRNKEFLQAQNEIDAAIGVDRNQPPFHNLSGMIQLRTNRPADAEVSFRKALALNSNYQPAWRGLGALYLDEKRYQDAIPPLKRSLEIFPEDPVSNYTLGLGYFRLEQYQNAIAPLEVYRHAAPREPEINGMLGICYENTGDSQKAYESYTAQVEVAPDTDMGRYAAQRLQALGVQGK
jgi:predicted Zn-dependent protease